MKKKIAIIGSGISGLTAALELQKKYEVHVYEKIHILEDILILMKFSKEKKNF